MTRRALVSGGLHRIGEEIASCLLADKVVDQAVVIGTDPVVSTPPGMTFLRCDASDPDDLALQLAAIAGDIHVLVNNIGACAPTAAVYDVVWPPSEIWEAIVRLDLTSAYVLTRAVRERMPPGSSICNVSSIARLAPHDGSPAAGAARAALIHWTRTLAVALAPRGIRVNAVTPGIVRTRRWADVSEADLDEAVRDRVPLATPGGRVQRPEDVGACVAFLSSDRARHVTGQVLAVDGGATLAGGHSVTGWPTDR